MRYRLSRFQKLVLAALALLSVDSARAVLGQEMHEFFNNTHQSPAAVDYGAAYYTRTRAYDNPPSVVTAAPPRQASLGYGELSITSWLGRRASGIAYLGVQLDRPARHGQSQPH